LEFIVACFSTLAIFLGEDDARIGIVDKLPPARVLFLAGDAKRPGSRDCHESAGVFVNHNTNGTS
jgi:hypothetical protein